MLVNTPATVDLSFEKVGAVQSTVSDSAEAAQVNTTDATLGNAVAGKPNSVAVRIPQRGWIAGDSARRCVSRLKFDPERFPTPAAARWMAVSPTRKRILTADVNDQQNRASFTSVLAYRRFVQNSRTTTTKAGAIRIVRRAGTMITRSGTNTVHGRPLASFATPTPAPIAFSTMHRSAPAATRPECFRRSAGRLKDKLFYFLNWEGRKDGERATVLRTVPTSTFREGDVLYGPLRP